MAKATPVVSRAFLVAVALALLGPAAARAQDKKKVDEAKKFLTAKSRAQGVLFFMHPSAEFKDVTVVEQLDVVDARTRRPRKDWFCLKVRFEWKSTLFNDSHTSDLLVYFNDKGRLDEIQAGTTSTFIKPFTASNVVIAAVKEKLLDSVEDEADKKLLRTLIADGDCKALLTGVLQLDQR